MSEKAFYQEYYEDLLGAECVKVEIREDKEEGWLWPVLTFQNEDRLFEVEVSRDEEGNGPGFLFGLENPNV